MTEIKPNLFCLSLKNFMLPMRHLFRPMAIVTALAIGFASEADAKDLTPPRYSLALGQDEPVCKDFANGLNHIQDWKPYMSPTLGLAIVFPLSRAEKKFTQPEWHAIELSENLDPVRRIYAQLYRKSNSSAELTYTLDQLPTELAERIEQQIEFDIKGGSTRLEEATVDIDNDGHVDKVYRYAPSVDANRNPLYPGWQLSIVSGNADAKDDLSLDAAFNWRSRDVPGPARFAQGWDIFFYNHKTYLLNFSHTILIEQAFRTRDTNEIGIYPYAICGFDREIN